MMRFGITLISNANPKDPKDLLRSVWAAPPTDGLGDRDRAKCAVIGESGRMTLNFMKPAC